MEEHQIPHPNFKLPGIWDKNWVRPYESLWSILNTYKKVNAVYDNTSLMKLIGADTKGRLLNDYFITYGIYCNLSRTRNDLDAIISNLVPSWYIKQIQEIFKKKDIRDFFSDKINYCPECIKNGYHSIFHQLKGINKCPYHKDTPMISYLKQRYVFGIQSAYKGDTDNRKRLGVFVSTNMFSYNSREVDFEKPLDLPLPIERQTVSESAFFLKNSLFFNKFEEYNYIKPIGTDIYDKNIIPNIGSFLLDKNLKPEIIIYNIPGADSHIKKIMNKRGINCGLIGQTYLNWDNRSIFKYRYMQLYITEKLLPYSADEIDYKCYQIERGKIISHDDELGVFLLFLLYSIGAESVEDCLSDIRKINDTKTFKHSYLQYYPSDISIHELEIENFCISAQYYILEIFLRENFLKFKENIYDLNGMKKTFLRKDLILFPTHLIYVEKNNIIQIYRH